MSLKNKTKNWGIKICILILLPVIGCTTPGMIMKSWVGHREEELYRQWGPPSKVIDKGREGKLVMYLPDGVNKADDKKRYINAGKPPEYITPRNNEYKRIKTFYITALGNIYGWKWGE